MSFNNHAQKNLPAPTSFVPLVRVPISVHENRNVGGQSLDINASELSVSPSAKPEGHVFDREENYRILFSLFVGAMFMWIAVGSKAELAWVLVVGFGVGHLTGMYNMFYVLKHGFSFFVFAKTAWLKIRSIFSRRS